MPITPSMPNMAFVITVAADVLLARDHRRVAAGAVACKILESLGIQLWLTPSPSDGQHSGTGL